MLVQLNKEVECWLTVTNYEGYYEVSNLGRVKSLDRIVNNNYKSKNFKEGRILKNRYTGKGYDVCVLQKEGLKENKSVHRLVCETYKNNLNYKNLQVNHMNGDKKDNRIENLEWVTCKENIVHCYKVLNIKKNSDHMKTPIIQYDINNKEIKRYNSVNEASISTGTCRSQIWMCLSGKVVSKKQYLEI